MKKHLYILLFTISLFHTSLYAQWIQQPIPTSQVVQDIHFIDSLHGWLACSNGAVNDSGLILYTSTGGASWVKQYDSVSSPLFAIKMADLNTGYCVGGYRKILKTTNSGQNWMNTNITVGAYFKDIAVIDPLTFYVCVEDSPFYGILKSTNGGINYIIQFTANCNILNFINEQTGWAATSNFILRRTTNGGTNWVTLQSFSNNIVDIFFRNENLGWVIWNDPDTFLKTTNGGLNFTAYTYPPGTLGLGRVFMITDTYGWIGSSNSKILRTTDGSNFSLISTPMFSPGLPYFIDSLRGWAGGNGVIKTTTGGVSFIELTGNEIPVNFALFQNYPNPFNPVTTIRINLPLSTEINLVICNVLGKELYKLANQYLKAGEYSFNWDASDYSSGIYFYRLTAGNYAETKKIDFFEVAQINSSAYFI